MKSGVGLSRHKGVDKSDGNPFGYLDRARFSMGLLKVVLVSGMGFFTDAYDLFNINVLLLFLIPLWHLTSAQQGLLASSAIFSAIVGQLLFGRLLDVLGRKKVYGIEAAVLAAGAAASAFSVNFPMLLATRAVMGLGIGGDYPASSTIASEYSPTETRGRAVALVFSMQGFGIATAVVTGLIAAAFLPPDLTWRLVALVGAIPPALVIYFRRQVPETPRYSLLVKGDVHETRKGLRLVAGSETEVPMVKASRKSASQFFREYWPLLIGTTLPWLLMDMALYGTGVFSGLITSELFPEHSAVGSVLRDGVPLLVGVPGYFIAAALIDRVGRKPLQLFGFAMSAVLYLPMMFYFLKLLPLSDYLIYAFFGLSFTALNVGPNTTTFIVPAEVYPVRYRSTGHGISAAAGKAGAAITTLLFPIIKATYGASLGLAYIFAILSAAGLLGFAITYFFLPETKKVPLEEASGEELAPVAVREPAAH
ncbi:MAG: MFS transporter [Acidilobus sp.]